MSEPLNTGIKRIIWVATDKRYHRVQYVWWKGHELFDNLSDFKKHFDDCYITKHEIWV